MLKSGESWQLGTINGTKLSKLKPQCFVSSAKEHFFIRKTIKTSMIPNNKGLNHSLRSIPSVATPGLCRGCSKNFFPLGAFLGTVQLTRCSNGAWQMWQQGAPNASLTSGHCPFSTGDASLSGSLGPYCRDGLRKFPKIFLC